MAQARYRILAPQASRASDSDTETIGEGAYGVVYQAFDMLTKTMVALKKIKWETESDGISSSTLREITFLRQLRHDNVVTLRDVVWQPSERICLVFDLEDGDLANYLARCEEDLPMELVRVRL
jgi:serine/threonine protein kinase